MTHDLAPIATAMHYCLSRLGKKRWLSHMRPWDVFVKYCVTPPITPPRERVDNRVYGGSHYKHCIACGRTHVTSEDCGRERPEVSFRSSVPRKHDGYSLQRAANMGCFSESDNWE